jgi:hypothetical protein
MTDDLIDRLAQDLKVSRPGALSSRLALAVTIGALVGLAGVLLLLGPRADLATAVTSMMFWMKLAYTGAIGAVGVICVERISRPAGRPGRRLAWLAAPALVIGVAALAQIVRAPAGAFGRLVMGNSASSCSWLIAAASIPLFVVLMWAVRGLGPTRLRLAGALTGLTAGGVAASIYCLHCDESGAPFVAIWYSLGILAPCAVGALTGPRLLRW